jgi:FkbM family methyltransferase
VIGTSASTISSESDRRLVSRAASWHEWTPRWLPSRLAALVRRAALTRYRGAIACELPTGQRFLVDPSDLVQCLIATTGGWEQLIFDAVEPFVSPGETVLDVGAHVGYAAVRFAAWAGPSGHVACFEPVPSHVKQLSGNLRANGFETRTMIVPMAVCDEEVERDFFDSGRSNSGMGSLTGSAGHAPSRRVRTTTIDAWLAGAGVADVALTKIDVEGAEALVVRGMARTLAEGRHRAVLVELHPGVVPDIGRDLVALFERLGGASYELYDWLPAGRFVRVRHGEAANYLLAVRRDSTHWLPAPPA